MNLETNVYYKRLIKTEVIKIELSNYISTKSIIEYNKSGSQTLMRKASTFMHSNWTFII